MRSLALEFPGFPGDSVVHEYNLQEKWGTLQRWGGGE